MRFRRLVLLCVALTALGPFLSAQGKSEDRDSLLVLVSAKSASLLEENGQNFRKVLGPARFFHNNTYLLCDTALWNVTTNIVYASGHVQIIQNRTVLSSETLEYVVDEDLAKFRGQLVQLEDKDKNTLRTRFLDYNTKDSVAVFQNGASMRDKDGQLIESRFGSYDAKEKTFTFMDNVNMFTDSIFIKTSRLEYRSEENMARFGYGTDAWEHENMLSADDGWYDRARELFFFRKNVHVQSKDQEGWSDTLYYHRLLNDVEMRGRAEIMDTTRNVYGLAGKLVYSDSLSKIKMTRKPAIMSVTEDQGKRDTLYFGADTLVYQTIPRCDIPEPWVADSKKRVTSIGTDAVAEYRKRKAEEAATALENAKKQKEEANRPLNVKKKGEEEQQTVAPGYGDDRDDLGEKDMAIPPDTLKAPSDSLKMPLDSLKAPLDSLRTPSDTLEVPTDSMQVRSDSLKAPTEQLKTPADSLKTQPDSLLALPGQEPAVDSLKKAKGSTDEKAKPQAPRDSTKIAFLWAVNRVRLYRDDIQMACDSLAYSDLDSLVRMYRNPLVFNENGTRQYAADSLYVVIENQEVKRANLLSNAFIATQEDSLRYNQIRGSEVVAYFNDKRALDRFDALGDATALFFLEENGTLATVNRVECKMLYATFAKGTIDHVYYFESAKNDAYPIVQLPEDVGVLKGFSWQPEKRPAGKEDVTPLEPRKSQRLSYEARPKADFPFTEDYFPGYIKKVHDEIAKRDALAQKRKQERQQKEAERERLRKEREAAAADSLKMAADSLRSPADSLLAAADSLGFAADSLSGRPRGRTFPSDSLSGRTAPKDSLAPKRAVRDSLSMKTDTVFFPKSPSPEELKEQERVRKAAEAEAKKKARLEAREARWAESDRKYEEKQEAKRQKALQKERARKLRDLKRREKKAAKEKRRLDEYIEHYTRQRNRAIRKERSKPVEKAPGRVPPKPMSPSPVQGEKGATASGGLTPPDAL